MRKFKFIGIILVLCFIAISCTPRQVVLTPEQEANRAYFEQKDKHTQAVNFFTERLTKYNVWCANQEYVEACAKVDPIWKKANTALDTWGTVIEAKNPASGAEAIYQDELKALKTAMLMELPNFIW